jgi:hypothetical protein
LTFTHDAWDEAYQALSLKFPNQSLVGWYHSHPGFGVFMSEYDAFIQQNFFGTQGQYALVVDPLGGRRGWFRWDKEKIKSIHEEKTKREALGGEAADYKPPKARERVAAMESTAALRLVATVLVMLLAGVAGYTSGKSNSKLENQNLKSQYGLLEIQVNQLANSLIKPIPFETQKNDPKQETIYIRYALNDFEKTQGNWIAIIAQKFGLSIAEVKKLNPKLNKDGSAPSYVNVSINGWKVVPPAIIEPEAPKPSDSPTVTASPSPSKSGAK